MKKKRTELSHRKGQTFAAETGQCTFQKPAKKKKKTGKKK